MLLSVGVVAVWGRSDSTLGKSIRSWPARSASLNLAGSCADAAAMKAQEANKQALDLSEKIFFI